MIKVRRNGDRRHAMRRHELRESLKAREIEERLIVRKWNDRGFHFREDGRSALKRENVRLNALVIRKCSSVSLTSSTLCLRAKKRNTAGDREVPGKCSDREGYRESSNRKLPLVCKAIILNIPLFKAGKRKLKRLSGIWIYLKSNYMLVDDRYHIHSFL